MAGDYVPHLHDGDPFHPPGGILHVKSTILWSVLPEVLFFSAIAAGVCLISDYVYPLHIATTLLTVFGTVLGFIISYRTSSAYDKYSEGRKLWSQVTLASRSFSRIAWLHVPNQTRAVVPAGSTPPASDVLRSQIEKRSMINLVAAFNVALKHYLRGEAGIFYKDLYPLVCWLPKYHLPTSSYFNRADLDDEHTQQLPPRSPSLNDTVELRSSAMTPGSSSASEFSTIFLERKTTPMRSGTNATWASTQTWTPAGACTPGRAEGGGPRLRRLIPTQPLLPSRNPPPSRIEDYIPWYAFVRDIFHVLSRKAKKVSERAGGRKKRRKPIVHTTNDNIPLEITILLSGWVNAIQTRGLVGVPTLNSLLAAVQSLSEALTGLERVLLTPIPVAYSLHLRHTIWLYLFLLPSQLHLAFGWVTVPATAIAAFVFLGFIQIGQEIESPFGYDDNDLNLDQFCTTLIRELNELTAHPPSEAAPENFCFVDTNLPLATAPLYEGLSALQMVDEEMDPLDFEAGLKTSARGLGRSCGTRNR